MANIKISDLTSASAAADANEFEINESGTSKKVTGSQIKAYVNAGDGALAAKDTVATADIDNLAVTTGKLAADAVDGTKIADDAIGNEHIATDAVNADSIAANAVGASELNVPGNGTAGQYLASDGDGTMTWTTLAAGGGNYVRQQFTSPGTWTKPANVSAVKVSVVGGGGGGGNNNPAGTGGTSSFGAFCSATGGTANGRTGTGSIPGVGSGGNLNLRGANFAPRSHGSPTIVYASSYVPGFSGSSVVRVGVGGYAAGTGYGFGGMGPNIMGGSGGLAVEYLNAPAIPGPVPVTVGGAGSNAFTNIYSGGGGVVVVEYWE